MKIKFILALLVLTGVTALPVKAQPSSMNGPANPVTNTIAFPPGWSLMANPLFHYRGVTAADAVPNNSVSELFPQMPNGAVLLKFDNTAQQFTRRNVFHHGRWSNPDETLAPSEGAFLFNPERRALDIVFTGNWGYGAVSIPAGLSLISSPGPGTINFATSPPSPPVGGLPGPVLMGRIITATTNSATVPPFPPAWSGINFNPQEGDVVYTFDSAAGRFQRHTFRHGAWNSLPVIGIGQSCFVFTSHPRIIQYAGTRPVQPE